MKRTRSVLALGAALGVLGGTAYGALAPIVGSILSGSALEIPFSISVPFGVALAAMLFSQLSGFACLTAFGRTRSLALSTVLGAILGGVLFVPLALALGVAGVVWGMAIAEFAVLVTQLLALRRVTRAGSQQNQ